MRSLHCCGDSFDCRDWTRVAHDYFGAGAVGWLTMAQDSAGAVDADQEQGYVVAAEVLGAGFWRILVKHMVPNASGTILVTLMMTVPRRYFRRLF